MRFIQSHTSNAFKLITDNNATPRVVTAILILRINFKKKKEKKKAILFLKGYEITSR